MIRSKSGIDYLDRLQFLGDIDTKLCDVLGQVGFAWTQFCAHRVTCQFRVRCTVISSLFVEVTDRGPAASAGAEVSTIRALRHSSIPQVDVAKHHSVFVSEVLHNLVPFGSLFASSASALGGDKADKHCLASIDGSGDFFVEVVWP